MLADHDSSPRRAEPQAGRHQCPGPLAVQLRGRLVEHDQGRAQRERARQRHPLLLAPGEGGDAAMAQGERPDRRQRLFDPARHLARRQSGVLEREGDVALDSRVHELGLGVLEDEPDRSGEPAGRRGQEVEPRDPGAPAEAPAVEMRHQAVEGAEEGRLAAPGRARHQRQAALHVQRQVPQGRRRPARVPVMQPVEAR